MPQKQPIAVPVYWCNDPILWSPCILDKPCGICVAHAMGRKMRTPCLNLRPVKPAYTLPVKSALAMVNDGTADLLNIHDYQCIRLKFPKPAQLRDASLKIDEDMLIAYADGNKRARAALIFWGNICGDYQEWTPEQMAESRERIQYFA